MSEPPLVRTEGPPATGERFRPFALVPLTVVLVGMCALVAVPFLPALTWAVALAVIAWPIHARLGRHVPRAGVAAGVSTLLVFALILIPAAFVTYHLAREAASAVDRMKQDPVESTAQEKIARTPGQSGAAAWRDPVGVDIEKEVRGLVAAHGRDAFRLVSGSVNAALQCLVGQHF